MVKRYLALARAARAFFAAHHGLRVVIIGRVPGTTDELFISINGKNIPMPEGSTVLEEAMAGMVIDRIQEIAREMASEAPVIEVKTSRPPSCSRCSQAVHLCECPTHRCVDCGSLSRLPGLTCPFCESANILALELS